MALALEGKKQIVADVNQTASDALSLVIADARGVDVSAMTELRSKAREAQINLRVVRNTLARRALEGTEYECVKDSLAGPSLFGFSMEDPGACARLFKDFAKENDNFEIKILAVGGEAMEPAKIDVLAKLPTRDQALASLAAVMIAPVTKLVRTFNEVPSSVTRVVAAVKDKKEAEAA